jgi:multiple sugar transport system ATP-binding protein
LYDRPVNLFVAGFVGSPAMTLLELPVIDGGVGFGSTILPVPRKALAGASGALVVVGVRPGNLEGSHNGLPIVVDVVEELGSDAYLYGRADGVVTPVVARTDWRNPPLRGTSTHLAVIDPDAVHHFAPVTGRRLGR